MITTTSQTDFKELGFQRTPQGNWEHTSYAGILTRRQIESRGWELVHLYDREQTFGGRRETLMLFERTDGISLIFYPESNRVRFLVDERAGRAEEVLGEFICKDLNTLKAKEEAVGIS